MQTFSWSTFFLKLHRRSSQTITASQWQEWIKTYQGKREAIKLLGLAYLDSQSEEDCNLRNISNIADEKLGFQYNFTQSRERLIPQLELFGVSLLQASNGDFQYIRTIRRLSGKMYVRFASRIAAAIKRKKDWLYFSSHKNIEDEIRDDLDRYIGRGQDSETIGSRNDIIEFFHSLIDLYHKRNAYFSIEDIKRQELATFTDQVAEQIHHKLIGANGDEMEEINSTIPQIGVDGHFVLPDIGVFGEDILPERDSVVFSFKNSSAEPIYFIKYDYNSYEKQWRITRRSVTPSPFIYQVKFISRDIYTKENGKIRSDEVMPTVCEQSHALFECSAQKSQVLLYESALNVLKTYVCIPLQSSAYPRVSYVNDEGVEKQVSVEANNSFTLPADASAIIIENVNYPIKHETDDWFNSESHCDYAYPSGPRWLFFNNDVPIIEEITTNQPNLVVKYVNGQNETILFSNGTWNDFGLQNEYVPQSILWKKGSLVILENNKQLIRKPITFIPPISGLETVKPISFGETGHVNIEIDGEDPIGIDFGPTEQNIIFSFHDFSFRYPIPRFGVYFDVNAKDNKKYIPVPADTIERRNVTDIAEKDLKNMRCNVRLNYSDSEVKLTKGTNIVSLGNTNIVPISGQKLLNFQGASDYYCIVATFCNNPGKNEYFKFHTYNPIKEPVDFSRVDNNYRISHYVSVFDSQYPKYLSIYLANHQDLFPVHVELDIVKISRDEMSGRLLEELTLRDISKLPKGGLICFITVNHPLKNGLEKMEVISEGFFIRNGEANELVADFDSSGIRQASDKKNIAEIERIMRSSDQNIRQDVTTYIEALKLSVGELNGYSYFNSYRCTKGNNNISGYLFMADWYFEELYSTKPEEASFYDKYWYPTLYSWYPMHHNETVQISDCKKKLLEWYQQIDAFVPAISQTEETQTIRTNQMDEALGKLKQLMQDYQFDLGNSRNINYPLYYDKEMVFTYAQLSESVHVYTKISDNAQRIIRECNRGIPSYIIRTLIDAWKNVNSEEDSYSITHSNGTVRTSIMGQCLELQNPDIRELFHFIEDVDKSHYLFYKGYDSARIFLCRPNGVWRYTLDFACIAQCLTRIGQLIKIWRTNPTLSQKIDNSSFSIQEIRDFMFRLKEIDTIINKCTKSNDDSKISLCDIVEMLTRI